MKNSKNRVAKLRQIFAKNKITGFIIPRQDEFQGEYVAPCAERLKWLSGFGGSWGTAIVMQNKAAIFVDGRYTIQVREQVDMKVFDAEHLVSNPPTKWIEKNLQKNDRLGFDPWLLTISEVERLQKSCATVGAILVPVAHNLVDQIWDDQPAPPESEIIHHPMKYAGQSIADKLKTISGALKNANADATVLADPSSVAWAFNLRSTDIAHVPVALIRAIIKSDGSAEIFATAKRLTAECKKQLFTKIKIKAPKDFDRALQKLKGNVALDFAITPQAIKSQITKTIHLQDPCTFPRAQKNKTEQQGSRIAHIIDGVAMVKFLHWFEKTAQRGNLNEASASDQLSAYRDESDKIMDLSFGAISASGPNAAIPHYHLDRAKPRAIKRDEIYLIDSGGQYREGTTDITRTVIVGKPTTEMKDRFTRVLQGMIQLSMMSFPQGTTGAHLDAIARANLWKAGLDFDHGTGHGVGSYLSVHEGPARFSKVSNVELKPGMILSNEPGYYKAGYFGIRIENLLLITEPKKIKGGDRAMMSFETLNHCPIDQRLIDKQLLTPDEKTWLNAYHANVLKTLKSKLKDDTLQWLVKACQPL